MTDFVHLHLHTDYSLLDGAGKISDYVAEAKKLGMKALAITDHGVMFGVIRHYDACIAEGIKPIIGCEMYVSPKDCHIKDGTNSARYHLILLAKTTEGYKNLVKLCSIAYTEGFYTKPRVDHALLEQYHEGLICLSACLQGEVPRYIADGNYELAKNTALWYNSVFGQGNYYLEVQDHRLPEDRKIMPLIRQLSQETGIPMVATNDCHYVHRDDAEAQDVLMCIGLQKNVSDTNRMKYATDELYLKSGDEMAERFVDYPGAIENSVKIAEMVDMEIPKPGPILPDFEIPEGFRDTAEYLRHISVEGLHTRYPEVFAGDGNSNPEFRKTLEERLEYELSVIIKMHFEGYFLIVQDYVNWAKTHDVPVGPGRGSGAGSLVAYCIRITDIEPMEYDLLFERFLNPSRISMPDFDVDFCFEKRQNVIQYVTEHYGREKVAQIITFGTLKAKQVVKDVGRVLEVPLPEVNAICKLIPEDPKMTLDIAFNGKKDKEGNWLYLPSKELQEYRERGGMYAKLFEVARKLEGMSRHSSLHAAGIVIGKEPIVNYVPLYVDQKTHSVATQFTMDLIEDRGLVKMDFLGLKTLTLIKHTVELVKIKEPDFDLDKIPQDRDKLTFELFDRGDSDCIFQFESAGMKNTLKRAKPSNIAELSALNALYRPGPMDNIPAYIDGKQNPEKVKYPDPSLEGILKETFGVIVYQEQVMKVAQVLSGYSLAEADNLRKIMGKKKVDKLPAEEKKFIEGAVKNGHTEEQAKNIFELLKPFAGYGFNKSHAVGYTVLAYQTGYLKSHYPVEFIAANLTNEISSPDKFNEYLALCKSYGIEVTPPDINHSIKYFTVDDGKIIYGICGIKGVGEGVAEAIIKERTDNGPFKSYMDFLERVDSKVLSSKVVECLIQAGAFDNFGINRPTLLNCVKDAMDFVAKKKEEDASQQIALFGEEDVPKAEFVMKQLPDYSSKEKLEMEYSLLGFYVSGHPLDAFSSAIKKSVSVHLGKPETYPLGTQVSLVVQLNGFKKHITKTGKEMAYLTVSDYSGTCDVTVFPKDWERYSPLLTEGNIYGITGTFQQGNFGDRIDFTLKELFTDPNMLPAESRTQLHIQVPEAIATKETISKIVSLVENNPGELITYIHIEDKVLRAGDRFRAAFNDVLEEELRDLSCSVWVH